MNLRAACGITVALLLAGGAVAEEQPDNAAAFKAERERRISPANPHGYQPVPQITPTVLHPYDLHGVRSRQPERYLDERFGNDDRFGNDVPGRQRR